MDVINYILSKKLKKYVDDSVGNVPDEKITEAVNTYLEENPPTTGATAEQAAQINKNVADIDELKSDLDNSMALVESELFVNSYKGIDDYTYTNGYYINTSGIITSNASFRYSEKIPVKEGETFEYSIKAVNNVTVAISAYKADDTFVLNQSVVYTSESNSGSVVVLSGTYTVGADIAYIRIGRYNTTTSYDDSISIPYKYSKINDITERVTSVENQIQTLGIVNQWKDMRISAFGTSITDTGNSQNAVDPNGDPTGKYLPYLIKMGGFKELGQLPKTGTIDESKSNNFGIAGGKINGHILYYIRYYLDQGINSKYGNKAELITIEGSVNDYASSVPLGQVGDTVPFTDSLLTDSTENGTFAGACYCAFTEALQYAPNAVVVYLTESTGKYYEPTGNNFHQGRLNSIGLKQIDYINMAKAVAEYVGIPVIDCGRDSMINAQNPQYLVDWIHHTYLGGKQYASCIWSKLKDIPCKVTSVD